MVMHATHVAFMTLRPPAFTAAVVCIGASFVSRTSSPDIKVSNAMAMTWSVSSSLCICLKRSESMHA